MPTTGHTAQTEQRILNDSKDSLYDTIATTVFAETTVGSVAQRVTGTVNGAVVALDVNIASGSAVLSVALDKANDSVAMWSNTAKDGTGTAYQPLLDTDGHVQVDILSSALPTGAATAANQATEITHLSTLAGAVSGSEMQVDVITMPTTTVQATNLDIRDLTQASDSVLIYGSDDGGTTKRVIKTDSGGAIQVDLEVASVAITSFPDNEPFNLAQYGGSSVGASNALHVQPGTGATFQVQSNSANIATESTLSSLNSKVTAVNTGAVVVSSGNITADTELTTADLDTGVGTDTRAVVGLVGSASGGGELIPGSATDGLLVNLGANNDVTVTGSVTANAGTNLNTSALALETGGNLATIKTNTDKIPSLGQATMANSVPVAIASNQSAISTNATLQTGSNVIGALSANQSVNVAQMNGVAPSMGNGVSGTGVQRVTLASDSTGQVTLASGASVVATQGTATNLKTQAESYQGGSAVGSGNPLQVTLANGTVVPGTAASNLGKAEDAGHTTGDVGVMALGVANTAAANISGTTLDYTPISTDLTGAVRGIGNVGHDDVDAGNPLKIGLKAIAHGTNPTAVAAADRTDWYANRAGVPFVIGGHPNVVTLRANYTGAQTNTAIVTVAAGTKIVVTRCSVLASNANTVNVSAVIGFATATTPTTTGVVLAHPNIAAGSGVVEGNGAGMLGVGADDEDLRITSSVPTGGSIDVVVSYYTIPS